ncbi:MAG: FHA domain-containing protein [Myxococcota bacterium]|nr:FHA domain-containing protein [Myxococcota bacterium]
MKRIRLGSAPHNDIVITDASVAAEHAELFEQEGRYVLRDLGSPMGTFVNGQRIEQCYVEAGYLLMLGQASVQLSEAHLGMLRTQGFAATAALPAVSATQIEDSERGAIEVEVTAEARVISLGARPDNTVRIESPQVSGRHARITFESGRYTLVDLNSTNGTYINGTRILAPSPLQLGDRIGFGSYVFVFDDSIVRHFGLSQSTVAFDPSLIGLGTARKTDAFRLGRAPDNDIVIPAPQVSAYHAVVSQRDSQCFVRDLGSTNGTFINVREQAIAPQSDTKIEASDVLYLGSYRFPVSRLLELSRKDLSDQVVQLPKSKEQLTVGRDSENDIVLDFPTVSRKHAVLKRTPQGWILRDLGSANGTFVNAERISEKLVSEQDQVAFGTCVLRLDLEAGTVHKEYAGEIMLRAEDLCVDVPDRATRGTKRILDSVSFTAYPTELVGLMGPSGAGKTTLMMALNGYQPPSKGQSLINNVDLYRHYNSFRGNIGYVPQDDIIHKELTVFESLYFTAKLRLPPDVNDKEIEAIIDNILKELGIEDTKHVLIGSPLMKGISGGQRKRVNLAQELLTQPALLFLDEPTSGLASSDTRSVMALLRKLADAGRSILLTIHQPSLDVYREMDNVLYLARGKLVYYGPAHPDSITFFNPQVDPATPEGARVIDNPDNAMGPLAADNAAPDAKERLAHRVEAYRSSKYHKDYVEERREEKGKVQLLATTREKAPRRFGFRQWWTLTRRNLVIKRRDVANLIILLAQAPIIGLLVSLVFSQAGKVLSEDKDGVTGPVLAFLDNQSQNSISAAALFMLVASSVWFGTSNSAREIVGELAIYKRERMVNLKIPSFVLSKFAVLALLSLIQCALLLGISYPLLGFEGSFLKLLLALFLCATAGLGMGLVLSSVVRSTEAAVALVPLMLIPQLVLGGLIVPLSDFQGGVLPSGVRQLSNVMVARWTFEGLLHAEDERRSPSPKIRISNEEQKLADNYWEEEYKPSLVRIGGKRKVSPHRQDLTKAFLKAELAEALNEKQTEESMVDRYFGDFARGYWRTMAVLLGFNVILLGMVCLLLRRKDLKGGS